VKVGVDVVCIALQSLADDALHWLLGAGWRRSEK
jgi:hypothetical protein